MALLQKIRVPAIVCLLALVASAGLANASKQASQSLPRCLYVSSYHSGYDWSDGVEEGVRAVLAGKCQLRQFDMDTKRKRSAEDIRDAALQAKTIIDTWRPDIVLTSDDNAAKHLIVPFYKDSAIPFIFSGVNWTVEEYGFPFSNVTGIVEIAPIEPMLKQAIQVGEGRNGVYLGAATLTEEKNYARILKGANRLESTLEKKLVSSFEDWKIAYREAHSSADFVVVGSNSGIANWDNNIATEFAQDNAKVISVTNHLWMMDFSALGYTKIPQEHGEWAARAGLEVLAGTKPIDIPIITNRKWDLWVNQELVNLTGSVLPTHFSRKAKKLVQLDE